MSTEANFKYNILTFDHIAEPVTFSFYKEKEEGRFPIWGSEIPTDVLDYFKKQSKDEIKCLYTDFIIDQVNDNSFTVNLAESPRFAKHYYSYLLYQYLKPIAHIITKNFVKDITIYRYKIELKTDDYAVFDKFTFKIQIGIVSDKPEIIISYSGTTRISLKNILDLHVPPDLINTVAFNKDIYKLDYLIRFKNPDRTKVFPILTKPLSKFLRIDSENNRSENKYLNYNNKVNEFCKDLRRANKFNSIFKLNSNGFLTVPEDNIFIADEKNRTLVYGNGNTGYIPKNDMKRFGPYFPSNLSRVEFFMIYHINDKDSAQFVMDSFNNGASIWKGFTDFSKINFYFPAENVFAFKSLNNPMPEIKEYLTSFNKTPGTTYLCIYLTPHDKHSANSSQLKIYYQLKAELLKHNIVCQAIRKSTLNPAKFKYSVINIGIAIIAKLNGTPWLLQNEIKDELIVGVGAYSSRMTKGKYIGSAFCFSNDGKFQGFNCYSTSSSSMLAGSIREAVCDFIEKHKEAKRLIIHYYKQMSKKDYLEIDSVLRSLHLDIPVIVITVFKSESKDIIVFDDSVEEKMPESGTFFHIGRNQYLLCNNSRYGNDMPSGIEGFPFPIKLTFWASDKEIIEDKETVHQLVNQVYQFSRLYWKSVTQQNLPVTVKYPEMISEMFPNFDLPALPEFAKETLWFL